MKKASSILIAAVILFSLYFGLRPKQLGTESVTPPQLPQTSENTEAAQNVVLVPADTPPDTRLNRMPDGRVKFRPALEASRRISSTNPPQDNLAEIETLLGHYRFAYGENPVGVENFEFTEQLLGKNPKRIVFIASGSSALRGNELVDQWSTPYFFHSLSGQEMEIKSAGPDQKFWTDDDISSAQQD